MGLRCIIGHDFGEIQTERDRRERGEEVIVTIREFRECDRCGETRVVSENKEVRSAVTMDRATPPEDGDERDGAGDLDHDAAVEADAAGPGEGYDDVDAEEDDGVILEEEPEERQPGEWPEDETAGADDAEEAEEPSPWPEVEGEDEGYAAEVGGDEDLDGVEFGSGLTPEAAASEASGASGSDDGGEVVEATGGGHGGFRRASPGPSPTGRQRSDAAETEFYCPECGFTTPTEDSSLRPGDICPDCRLGYLTEQDR